MFDADCCDVESFLLSTPIMSRQRWLDLFTIGDDGGVRLLLNLSILFAATTSDWNIDNGPYSMYVWVCVFFDK
jgi:hypothetical protein